MRPFYWTDSAMLLSEGKAYRLERSLLHTRNAVSLVSRVPGPPDKFKTAENLAPVAVSLS